MWRLAEPDDDDAIVALCAALYAEDPSPVAEAPAHMAETLRALRARPSRGRAVVCAPGAEVLGYALILPFWSNELGGPVSFIDELYVGPAGRGRGLGSALLNALSEGAFADEPPVALMLEVTPDNHRAQALYARLGFSGKNRAWRKQLRPAQPSSAS